MAHMTSEYSHRVGTCFAANSQASRERQNMKTARREAPRVSPRPDRKLRQASKAATTKTVQIRLRITQFSIVWPAASHLKTASGEAPRVSPRPDRKLRQASKAATTKTVQIRLRITQFSIVWPAA